MSFDAVASIFETRIAAWAESEDLQVAFEGVSFKQPAAKTIYIKSKNLPSTSSGEFLDGSHQSFTGIWQVSIVCPKGEGTGKGLRLATSLGKVFKQNAIFSKDGFNVSCTSPLSIGPWVDDPATAGTAAASPARMTLPCSFVYRGDSVS